MIHLNICFMNKNNGFTLIEVLIAMLLLAGGLLGLAALQAFSLNNNQSAYNRSQATQMAYDIADRMRANFTVVGNYRETFMAPTAATCATSNTPCTACTTPATTCTTAQIAVKDLYEWNKALLTLPSGTGHITLSGAVYTVTITWLDDKQLNKNASFAMSFQL
jgi:type IV pilus assembly protein PilV